DEAVIAFQPSSATKIKAEAEGEPIPVVFIPRKPHPNGLLLYAAVTMVDNPIKKGGVLPFVLDMLPHLTSGDFSPAEAVETFIQQWIHPEKPHIIGDSAFGDYQ